MRHTGESSSGGLTADECCSHGACSCEDEQLSSLDVVASTPEEAQSLVALFKRLVEHCQEAKRVRHYRCPCSCGRTIGLAFAAPHTPELVQLTPCSDHIDSRPFLSVLGQSKVGDIPAC